MHAFWHPGSLESRKLHAFWHPGLPESRTQAFRNHVDCIHSRSQGCKNRKKIRRPSVERLLDHFEGIGFTLSPYPLSLQRPSPAKRSKTCKNTTKTQKYAFPSCFKRLRGLFGISFLLPLVFLRVFAVQVIRLRTFSSKTSLSERNLRSPSRERRSPAPGP